jgi:DNA-binding transcriptional LysR family regulator
MPRHPSELHEGHLFVNFFKSSTGRSYPALFQKNGETFEIEGRYQVAVNETASYVAACAAGLGIIQAARFMVQDRLESGQLVEILPDWTGRTLPLHVVYAPNRHLSNKLRVFVDWVAGLFAQDRLNQPLQTAPDQTSAT